MADLKISQLTALGSSPSASDLLAIVNGGSTKKITYQNLMTVPDDIFTLADNLDTTKKVMFQLSSLTTATTRTLTAQDKSGLIAVQTAALTASRALVSDASGFVSFSAATATELGYLSGVTSAVQTQLTGKINKAGDSGVTTFNFLSGNGIDVDATGGSDVLNIGASNADIINIGRSGATVNIIGSLQYSNVTNLEVVDALIRLNKGGGAASATDSGFEIEESGSVSAYFKTIAARNGYILKAPSIASTATFSLASLSSARTYTLPDATGTLALTSDLTPYYKGDVLFDHLVNSGNVGTSETDLYTDTLAAGQLSADGDKVAAMYSGIFVSSATATRRIRIYFGGTLIYDSTAITDILNVNWEATITIMRHSSSVVSCSVTYVQSIMGIPPPVQYTAVSGLTLSNTQILKVTGTATGAGAATDDVIAKFAYGEYKKAA